MIYKNIILLIAILSTTIFKTQAQNALYASLKSDTAYKSSSENRSHRYSEYDAWSTLLRKNISIVGAIDYSAFKADDERFEDILADLSKTRITKKWSKNEKMAFWINVYNAFSVKLIADNFPVRSMKEISKPYRTKFFEVGNTMLCLQDVEDILSHSFDDPRALLVLNKGTVSGVKLIKLAYTAQNLDDLLDKRVRLFINDGKHNLITPKVIRLSSLFKIYEKEFEKKYGSVPNFINRYSDIVIRKQRDNGYMDYDDTVNSYQEMLN